MAKQYRVNHVTYEDRITPTPIGQDICITLAGEGEEIEIRMSSYEWGQLQCYLEDIHTVDKEEE